MNIRQNLDLKRADDPLYYWDLCSDTIDSLIKYGIKTESEVDVMIKDCILDYKPDDNFIFHLDFLDEWEDDFTDSDIVYFLKSARALIRDNDPDAYTYTNPVAKNEWKHIQRRIWQDKQRRKIISVQGKINGYRMLVTKAKKSR